LSAPKSDHSHDPVAILGAGSWGTALAIQFARAGHSTRLWSRNSDAARTMSAERHNRRYLPDAKFPDSLDVHRELREAVKDAMAIIIAVPSHSLRELLTQLKPLLTRDSKLAWATKGFELETGKLPHQVAYEVLGDRYPVAVLSGPTFAREVGMGLPTAMTIASPDAEFANQLAQSLHASNFRAYTSTDIIGVEVGGAVKNVLAVGAGLSDGL
jgi:glycerol-3-phosphate dehydrogenase (NAD(P)+)